MQGLKRWNSPDGPQFSRAAPVRSHKLLVRTSLIIIEIHPVDGFLGGKIHFQISRSIGKSGFRFSKSKSGFLNRMHP